MASKVAPGPVSAETDGVREAVCIHAKKIFDACTSRDCLEDLRFYPTQAAVPILAAALTLKGNSCELLRSYVDVEPVSFNRGYYTVDIRHFYRVKLQAYQSTSARGAEVEGLCVFDKRCILFGSEGSRKVFTSGDADLAAAETALPLAVVEAVDPIVLGTKLLDRSRTDALSCPLELAAEIPEGISAYFASPLVTAEDTRRVLVTLGQFSIVRLERDTQLLIPVYDYCLPEKTCGTAAEDDPCEMFRSVSFPINEFFPPNTLENPTDYQSTKTLCGTV